MLVLTFFACFGKQVSVRSPILKEKWEATSMISASNITMARNDCRMALVNKHMLENGMCKTMGTKTLCKGTLSGFVVTYGIENNRIVCKKA